MTDRRQTRVTRDVRNGRGGRTSPSVPGREVDGEHAPLTWDVADLDRAAVGLGGLQGDGQPQAEAAAVGPALHHGREQLLDLAGRQPPQESATSISTRPRLRRASMTTRPAGWLNLMALSTRLVTA